MSQKQQNFFWKGKRVTYKVYKKRQQQQLHAKNIQRIFKEKYEVDNVKKESDCKIVEGRRIVHIETLGKQLICNKCNAILSLTDIVEEKKVGLASIFYVRCRECKAISSVHSDKHHKTADQNINFDTNTKAVIGVLNTGNGNTHLNGMLSAFNIPEFNWKLFKTHEREVGKVVEEMALQSCHRAAVEERQLTIKNVETVERLM